MRRCIVSLAEVYSYHWVHRVGFNEPRRPIFGITSQARPETAPSITSVKYVALLTIGWSREPFASAQDALMPTHISGFSASVYEVQVVGGRERGSRCIWQRAYPLSHIPIPATLT